MPTNQLALIVPEDITIDQWAQQGSMLHDNYKQINWFIGDWFRYGVNKFGAEAQSIAINTFGRTLTQIKNAVDVAERFPMDARRPQLSFSHHAAVLPLQPEQADEVLDEAVRTNANVPTVKKTVAKIRESQGGDIFRQMAQASDQELFDDWYSKIVRLLNRCPSGVEGRQSFITNAAKYEGRIMDE